MLRTGVPEEDGLDLGGFWVEDDEGDPEGDVEEGLADRGESFVEGDRVFLNSTEN